jgi:hypothetical protein
MEVERVQKWVMSALLLTTAAIFSCGLALLSDHAPDSRRGAPQGLLVIAAIIGLAAITGVRVIHSKSVITPWLVVGLAPAALGWYFVFGR